MRALQCVRPRELALIERERPNPQAGEVLVRVRRVGVCGTDFHIFRGSQPYFAYPRVIGHELSGEIAEAPDGSALKVGEPVYVIPYLSCGACVACRRGKPNCCTRIGVLGVHVDGGMSDYVSVPERNVGSAKGLSIDQAAMVEFLAIGAHAARRGEVSSGDRVLIVGAGPIGLGCAMFSSRRGASVVVLDRREDRLTLCRERLKIDSAVEAGPGAAETLAQLTGGEDFDVVFDATGDARSMADSFGRVAHGGRYVLVGIVREKIAFDDPEFHKREMSVLASRNATQADFEEVVKAMREGAIPTEALATHRAPLDDAVTLFPFWMTPEAGVIKALIEI